MQTAKANSDEDACSPRRVVLATHYWMTGAASALSEYLRPRAELFLFVRHPLFPGAQKAYCQTFMGGKNVKLVTKAEPAGPRRFLAQIVRTIRWVITSRNTFDVFVAADSLMALAGIFLRRQGSVRSVVLYSVDFVPRRFGN